MKASSRKKKLDIVVAPLNVSTEMFIRGEGSFNQKYSRSDKAYYPNYSLVTPLVVGIQVNIQDPDGILPDGKVKLDNVNWYSKLYSPSSQITATDTSWDISEAGFIKRKQNVPYNDPLLLIGEAFYTNTKTGRQESRIVQKTLSATYYDDLRLSLIADTRREIVIDPTRVDDTNPAKENREFVRLLGIELTTFASIPDCGAYRGALVVDTQPIQAHTDRNMAPARLGRERMRHIYPFRRLYDSGLLMTGSSDAPMESANPWTGIWVAVCRTGYDGNPFKWSKADEVLTLDEARSLSTRRTPTGLSAGTDTARSRRARTPTSRFWRTTSSKRTSKNSATPRSAPPIWKASGRSDISRTSDKRRAPTRAAGALCLFYPDRANRIIGGRGSDSKNIRVRAGVGQRQNENVLFDLVDQKPVGCYVAFSMVEPISTQGVVSIFCRKRHAQSQLPDCVL